MKVFFGFYRIFGGRKGRFDIYVFVVLNFEFFLLFFIDSVLGSRGNGEYFFDFKSF